MASNDGVHKTINRIKIAENGALILVTPTHCNVNLVNAFLHVI